MMLEDLESMIAVFRRNIVRHYDFTYPDTDGEEDGLVFDDMIQTIKAEAWEEGADYGYDAYANGDEEKHNPYKEA